MTTLKAHSVSQQNHSAVEGSRHHCPLAEPILCRRFNRMKRETGRTSCCGVQPSCGVWTIMYSAVQGALLFEMSSVIRTGSTCIQETDFTMICMQQMQSGAFGLFLHLCTKKTRRQESS